MSDALITVLPRLELPTREGWYIDWDQTAGNPRDIYVLTASGDWVLDGERISALRVPRNLKRIGVVS